MLVLSRLEGERIVLTHAVTGDRIEFEIVQRRKMGVRLGVTAPKEWDISREGPRDREATTTVTAVPPTSAAASRSSFRE